MNSPSYIWNSISMFYSASTTQSYLHNCYLKHSIIESKVKSFQNTPVFIHYLKSAEIYYKEAYSVSLTIQPVLLFYGYIQLIKACLLSLDPTYPNSSTLLAHGVSTRKRKKQQYEFLKDEVKIQKNGLFPHMASSMFHVEHLDGEKINVNDLFYCIPELYDHYHYFSMPNSFPLRKLSNHSYSTTNKCLDSFHMSAERMETYLTNTNRFSLKCKEEKDQLYFNFEKTPTYNYHQPIRFNCETEQYQIIKKQETLSYLLNEMLIHYLLLYNLSMIARYETEWWMDLITTTPNEDFPFISKFLQVTLTKGPLLIKAWLFGERDHLFNEIKVK